MAANPASHILIVDDDPGILRTLEANLSKQGYNVETATTGYEALDRFFRQHHDLILLDLGLPDIDGQDVIRQVRGSSQTPIIVLSVREKEREKVDALDAGANDYVTKPFGLDELIARVRVSLRQGTTPVEAVVRFRTTELEVDFDRRSVKVNGKETHLTPTEYGLLKTLVSHPNKVLTDRTLLQEVWGPEYASEAHYLHVYMGRLRKKIESDPQKPRHLRTEPGVGYRFVTE